VLALVANGKDHDGTLPHFVEFLMWSFVLTCAVSTVACVAVAEFVRQSEVPTPARSQPAARV
jgi:hypothetical protein